MIKLINNSGRRIDLTKNLSIPADKSFEGEIEITPRIYQLIQMGLLSKIDIKNEKSTDNTTLTEGAKRRQNVINQIEAGFVNKSIPLDYDKSIEAIAPKGVVKNTSTTKRTKKRK